MIILTALEYTHVNIALLSASLLIDPQPNGDPRDPADVQRSLQKALDILGTAWDRRVRQ